MTDLLTIETDELTPSFIDRERYSDAARATLYELDRRIDGVVDDVTALEGWGVLVDPTLDNRRALAILREVMLSVVQYQAYTTEAGMHWLGRLPKTEHRMMRSLVNHKAEEAEHGGWALRDFLRLGGTEERARAAATARNYAIAAVWWRMATIEDPFGYLGAEYLFENLTARLCVHLLPAFRNRGLPLDQIGFLVEHATEDVKHTHLITHHILDAVTRYPESSRAILRCFDLFRHVYPVPVWSEASDRALRPG